jgi:dTMP kinase
MSQQGIFISFEGIDGAGKSSHIEALEQAYLAQGRRVTRTREPGGTPLSEQLRDMLLHQRMDALTEALLMFAARREHVVQVIEPALQRGDVLLCDRFTDATFAYQGYGRGFDLEVLKTLEQWVQKSGDSVRQPDLTLWFDVPPAVAAERLAQARTPDKFEAMPQAFFERVAHGYASRMQADPRRFARINGHQSLDKVRAEVMAVCQAQGGLK